ncbi:hypothetical protein PPL_10752 [Heterostelium album PN500]|uniref:Uncharacterized protein n=1 Tax=Heterostelium pallidum (strain ATCC 26659 / Pp 5 / PN500) TaxID=670386 RepID=D3BSC6_HETP5|nr:hypothetical protein PPL_10752 [Heterostelium album PN500]EFA75699.1 hypothetical protein PPL_10752 [Heterostelium album PN500]|eukprot:XP_020427833.1 hypothetical protein PPL_10752 [Heterostelium album PN500]
MSESSGSLLTSATEAVMNNNNIKAFLDSLNSTSSTESLLPDNTTTTTPLPTPTATPGPPGFKTILSHVFMIFWILAVVLVVLTSITLISRAVRRYKVKSDNKLSLRTRIELYLTSTGIINWIEGVQVILSVFSVGTFIYGTYLPNVGQPPLAYTWTELCLTIFFTLHWMLDYYISKDRLKYLYSFFSIVDLVTVLPIYIDMVRGVLFLELSTFQFLRVLRTVRVLRANRVLHNFNDTHPDGAQLKFHQTIYFLVVTLTTCGYGDIHPSNAVGQLTITFAICIGAVLIPYQVSKLLDKFSAYSPYKRDLSNRNLHGHILLCGEINFTSLLEFLTEFYLEKYGQLKKTIVILNNNPPSDQLKILLMHPFYKNRLYYLEGSPMLESDLKRARFAYTSSCFVFRPMFWEEGDADSILTALAMRNIKSSGNKIFTQLVDHESKNKISSNVNHVMCIEDFRNGILVQSTLCPGFGTMVCNLFTSRQPESHEEEKWVEEYVNGSVNSIYKIPVPASMVGETLGFVTVTMYSGAKALVLGIIDDDEPDLPNPHVVGASPPLPIPNLNPEHHKCKFTIHPPFSTILKHSMHLIIIAHSPTAPVFKPNIPSIIRKIEEDDTGVSYFSTLFNRLFAPEEIGRFTQLKDDGVLSESVQSFFSSTFTPAGVEMESFSPITQSPTQHASQSIFDQPSQDVVNGDNSNNNNNNPVSSLYSNNNNVINLRDSLTRQLEKPNPILEMCAQEFNNNWEEFLCTIVESVDAKKSHLASIVEDLEPIVRSIEKHQNLDNDDLYEEQEEENNWKEHIIICGSVKRVDLFLRGLRQKHIADNINRFYFIKNHLVDNQFEPPPIVILHPEEPDMSEWDDIEDIHFVKGSPLERKDLEYCKVHLAAKIIVLSDPYTTRCASTVTSETSVQLDADTIMAYLEVNEMLVSANNNTSFVTVELVHEPNIRFISKNIRSQLNIHKSKLKRENEEIEKPNYYITSEFASGKVLTLTTLDSLICQSNHQEYLLEIAQELVLGVNGIKRYHKKIPPIIDDDFYNEDEDTSFAKYTDTEESEASDGEAKRIKMQTSTNSTTSLNGGVHLRKNFSRTSMIKSNSGINLNCQFYQDCLLNQIKVPDQFHGRTYGELFEGLVQKNILSLGLYRCKEITGAPNPYVFTCPPSTTILHENDLVYILYRQFETTSEMRH